MTSVFITGGAGFIGSRLANTLSRKHHKVISYDNLSMGKVSNLDRKVTFVWSNIIRNKVLESFNADTYVHLAGPSSSQMFTLNREKFSREITSGFLNVLETARKRDAKKVILTSTSSVYGNTIYKLTETARPKPMNPYAVAKLYGEQLGRIYHEQYGMEIIVFRPMSIYGPGEKHKGRYANMVSQFIWKAIKNKPFEIYGDGTQTRDFTYITDVVHAYIKAIKTKKRFGFEVFNIGTGRPMSMADMARLINEEMGTGSIIECVPNPIKTEYIHDQEGNITKIKALLGWKPETSLEDGIKKTIDFYNKTLPK